DPIKYGGFDGSKMAYAIIIEYEKQKRKVRIEKKLIQINIMEREAFEKDEKTFLEEKGYHQPKVLIKVPKYTLYECKNGRRRMLGSANEAHKGNQMLLPNHLMALLYHAEKYEAIDGESLAYIEVHRALFDELLAYISEFARKYTLSNDRLDEINMLYERNKDGDVKSIAESFVSLKKFNAFGVHQDFSFFGTKIERKRDRKLNELLNSTIIYQSITGLYESRKRLDN
ncbi:type II CRISPR RNA-guided endonuclease Cas9, partial [Listeria monocytogenes]|nr:type II CRISPR RNA-guided endonuclease Cas9 [Listeria monocytogenes]